MSGRLTLAMFQTLKEDASIRTADASVLIDPSSGATTNAMSRFNIFTPLPTSDVVNGDAAERMASWATQGTIWISVAYLFPSTSNWTTSWDRSPGPPARGCAIAQLAYNGITAGSDMIFVEAPGYQGLAGPCMVWNMQGGETVAHSAPEDRNYINPSLGTGWNTHYPAATVVSSATERWPQILGPNTFLNAGSHLFTLDVWHEFLWKIVWASNTFTGSIEVWHRERGSGLAFNQATKTYEVFNRKNYQWESGQASGLSATALMKFGMYGGIQPELELLHDSITQGTAQADVENAFATETVSTLALELRSFRGRNDDRPTGATGSGEVVSTWKAAENVGWFQLPGEVFRVRVGLQALAATSGSTGTVQLQYRKNGGAWANVNAVSSVVRSATALNVADGAPTTRQLTDTLGMFITGSVDEIDGSVPAVTLTNSPIPQSCTEHEFAVQLVTPDVTDNDLIEMRVTASGDANILETRLVSMTVLGGAPPVGDDYLAAVQAVSGLVAHYPLDDTDTVLRDTLGLNNGSYVGGYVQGQPGIPGSPADSTDFNGTTGYGEVPDATAFDFGNDNFSIVAWVKRDSSGTLDVIASKGTGAYQFTLGTDDKLHFGITSGADIVASTSTLTDTSGWHMAVVSYTSGTTVSLYLDNVDVSAAPAAQVLTDNAQPLKIGALLG